MKKILALVLVALMLVSGLALAEERPYMRQIHQNTYVHTLFITHESYPEIRLSPSYLSSMMSGFSEPWVIRFDAPANAQIASFDVTECSCIDENQSIQYAYQAMDSYSFESLLNNCENDDYIIADGSAGYAAYVEPGRKSAYGLVGLPEISKSAKLYISIYRDDFMSSDTDERRAEILAEMIVAEAQRVMNAKKVQQEADFWVTNDYRGFKMPSLDHGSDMLVFDFPTLPVLTESGTTVETEAYLYALEDNRAYLTAAADGVSIDVTVELKTNSTPAYRKEEDPENYTTVMLSDGSQFEVHCYEMKEKGETSLVYCSKLLANDAGYGKDEPFYLQFTFDGHYMKWKSYEEITALLETVMKGVSFSDVNEDPYVPGADVMESEVEEPAAAEPAAAPETGWVCASCNTGNSGNFCSNCGAKAPETGWICANCNTENEGNFCSNCGAKKP